MSTYDFPDKEKGKACPYGVLDITNNKGWMNVGLSQDTAEFAVGGTDVRSCLSYRSFSPCVMIQHNIPAGRWQGTPNPQSSVFSQAALGRGACWSVCSGGLKGRWRGGCLWRLIAWGAEGSHPRGACWPSRW